MDLLHILLMIFLSLALITIVILGISIAFARIEYHAWYAFKEGALLLQVGKEELKEDPPLPGGFENCL